MFVDFVSRSARRSIDPSAPTERQGLLRRIPHFALQEAWKNAGSLRWRGIGEVNGKTQDVIAYTLDSGEELAIFVDAETHTVTKYEMNLDFPTLGNTVLEWIFPEHQPIEPLGLFPAGHIVKVGGRTYLDVTNERVEVNKPLPSEAFGLPADIKLPPPPEPRQESAPQLTEVTSIADGVFFVTNLGGFNTLFVEFADFVLAVEAPAEYPWLETLTTPGNRDFIHRMAESVDVREPLAETIDGKRVVSDGRRTVELINIGANPHTEEMIVVWIPKEGILFQGDLFYPIPLDYFPLTGRTIIMRHFAEWLRENQISPKRIYGVHGPWYGTEEHLNKIQAESEQPPEEDFLIKLTNIEF
jgi:hypothetical protein